MSDSTQYTSFRWKSLDTGTGLTFVEDGAAFGGIITLMRTLDIMVSEIRGEYNIESRRWSTNIRELITRSDLKSLVRLGETDSYRWSPMLHPKNLYVLSVGEDIQGLNLSFYGGPKGIGTMIFKMQFEFPNPNFNNLP